MWNLQTLNAINQKAANLAFEGKDERDALFLVTGICDNNKPEMIRELKKTEKNLYL